MNAHAAQAARIEAAFLAGVEANLHEARGADLAGSIWRGVHRSQDDRVRAALRDAGRHDRDELAAMPRNASYTLTGSKRRWLIFRRDTSVAIASVLSPIAQLVRSDAPPGPVGLAELVAHVRSLVGDANTPAVVGVCSPSGFTEEVRRSNIDMPNVRLVLIEPRAGGGWNVTGAGPEVTPDLLSMFDPEGVNQKLQRVQAEIDARSADLLTGGVSAATLSLRLGLPREIVERAFERRAVSDRELRFTRQDGEMILYRGASKHPENQRMSMTDRIKQLFSREGDETRKINELSARRAQLAQRRDRMYEDIAQLERREGELIQQGRSATAQTTKLRVASQIKTLRDDLSRLGTSAKVVGQQIEVISTDIHNLTLIQQGQMAKLPSSEVLAQHAVAAEEMLERLAGDAELAGSLSTGAADRLTSQEELDILKELEAPADREQAKPAAEPSGQSTATPPTTREAKKREPQT